MESCLASVHAQMLIPGSALEQAGGNTDRVLPAGVPPCCHLKVFLVEVEFDLPGVQAGVLVTRLLQALCQGLWPTEEHTNHRPANSMGVSMPGGQLREK